LNRIFIGSHSLPPLWFAASVLHRSVLCSFGAARWRCPSSLGTLIGEEGIENPNGVGGFGAWGFGLSLLLKPGAARDDAKAKGSPCFDRSSGRSGTCLLCACQASGVRGAGAKGEEPALAGYDLCARACAGRSACGPAGWGGCPIPRTRRWAARCGVAVRKSGDGRERVRLTG
jgi:hypothetical protein